MVTEEEPEPEGSETAGGCMLLAVSTGLGLAMYNVSRDLFVILVWVIGTSAVWWAAKKVHTPVNPAPPPLPEGVAEEEPQVTTVRDKTHPNRWLTLKPSRWMREEIDKERETDA